MGVPAVATPSCTPPTSVGTSMLDTWLTCQERNPCAYKFKVVDISELVSPNQDVVHYIATALLAAHGDPEMIREEYEILADDAAEVNLDILRNYINSDILPTRDI